MPLPVSSLLLPPLLLLLGSSAPAAALTVMRTPGASQEVLLRRAAYPSNGNAGEATTSSCRTLPFRRMNHAHRASFWLSNDDSVAFFSVPNGSMSWFNGEERGYSDVVELALRRGATPGGVVFDVGSNTGWYAVEAAAGYGVPHVYAFDMQPECIRRTRCASLMNHVEGAVTLTLGYVTDDDTGGPLEVPGSRCFGGVGRDWPHHFDWPAYRETVLPLHLGKYIARLRGKAAAAAAAAHADWRVSLMKIDIEGGEVAAANSLTAIPGVAGAIDHIVMEFSPHLWGTYNISAEEGVAAVWGLMRVGGFWAVDVPVFAQLDTDAVLVAATAEASRQHRFPREEGDARRYVWPPPAQREGEGVGRGDAPLLITSVGALSAYTEHALAVTSMRFAVFTLWLFRPTPPLPPHNALVNHHNATYFTK